MCNQKKDLENLDIPTKSTSLQALQKHVKCDKCIHLQAIKCGTNQPPFFQNMIFMHVLMDYVVQMGPSFMSCVVIYVGLTTKVVILAKNMVDLQRSKLPQHIVT